MNKNITIGILVVIIAALVSFIIVRPTNYSTIPQEPSPVVLVAPVPEVPNQSNLSTVLPAHIYGQTNWPPVITQSPMAYSCIPSTVGGDVQTVTVQRTINNRVYCVTSMSEGAAGTTYRTWTYTTAASSGVGTETTTFVLGYRNCGNYRDDSGNGGPEYNQCVMDQTGFDIDAIVDSLM